MCPEQDVKLLNAYDFVCSVACAIRSVRDLNIPCAHVCIFVCVCLFVSRVREALDLCSTENLEQHVLS